MDWKLWHLTGSCDRCQQGALKQNRLLRGDRHEAAKLMPGRKLRWIALASAVLCSAGAVFEQIGRFRDRTRLQQIGRSVSVGSGADAAGRYTTQAGAEEEARRNEAQEVKLEPHLRFHFDVYAKYADATATTAKMTPRSIGTQRTLTNLSPVNRLSYLRLEQ